MYSTRKHVSTGWAIALTLFAGMAAAQTTQVASTTDSTAKPMASGVETGANLTMSAAKSPNHTMLFRLMRASDITDFSSGKGVYTVFAPTNEAFSAFTETELSDLLLPANKKRLAKVLAYHVVKGRLTPDQLEDGKKLTNVTGQALVVHKQGESITITDERGTVATLIQGDIQTTNGVVYSVDKVLQTSMKSGK